MASSVEAKKHVPAVAVLAALVTFGVHAHLASADSYEVRAGDTLSEIAVRLGVSVDDLAAANGIDDPDLVVAGQMLVVPSDGGSATEYLVRDGDTLEEVADKVGIPVADLAAANGLDDPSWLPAGRLLSVPPVGAVTPRYSASSGAGSGSAEVGGAGRYTVRPGDSLSDIAIRMGVPAGQLAAANGISDANLIAVGEVLTVPRTWYCPVENGTFVNDYGYVNPEGIVHNGVDLFADRGTPIVAPVGGTVEPYPNNAGGEAVQLYGRDGNRYYFAHLDKYGASGEVGGGDVIGYVGNTGNARATSPHLHFEIHPGGGEAINPYPSLVAACR